MNILFVNYGDFTSNSLNHIGAFANQLTLLGHACVVAVPDNPASISAVHAPLFTPVTFERALQSEPIFPDRRPADLLHVWTPRENVREFTLRYLRAAPAATLLVHLEDNEAFLIESFAHESYAKLRELSDEELALRLSPRLSHPVRFRNFLRLAHGATYITDRLREFIPESKPTLRLLPGIDPTLYRPLPPDPALRQELGLASGEKLIVFTGSTTFANLADVRTLLLAVRLINDRGTPCRLVRTGINPPELAAELEALAGDHVLDLGFVAKARLGPLLALADVLVQPGTADAFNDYRLPSKIPEFLCSGRPVVMPAANLGREMTDGHHALLLTAGTPDEIAERCLQVFSDPALARRLEQGALEFAQTHFGLIANTASLLAFYESTRASAQPLITGASGGVSEDVLLAEGDMALRMRAKEQTIAHTRALVAARDGEIGRLETHTANQTNSIRALESAIADLRQGIKAHEHANAELQSTIQRLNAAHGEALTRNGALGAEIERQRAQHAVALRYQETRLAEARYQLEVLQARVADAVATSAQLLRQLEAADARAEAAANARQAREDKIQRMMQSGSWQVTAPLRWLRRSLVDPLRRSRSVAVSTAPLRPDDSLTGSIDEPADWGCLLPTGTLRGWALSRKKIPIVDARLRVGGRTLSGQAGLIRPDVGAAHPEHEHALRSGFVIDYALAAGAQHALTLEVQTADGVWRVLALRDAQVVREIPEHLRRDYATWIRRFDTPLPETVIHHRRTIETLPVEQQPVISVLMPVYNTPEKWLVKAIESVRAQWYPHWELCVADDASTAPHVRPLLEEYARRDPRIHPMFRADNGHISVASNSALELATGTFVALLDHDDELAPNALFEVVRTLGQHPDADLIYSDEDKIDEEGQRFDPYFKPDFMPDLFTAQNFTSHLSVYRAARVREVGGFRAGYEGSQDWDLALRVIDATTPDRIHHVPKILYHWRAIPGSTALALGEKSYPMIAARKALIDHFARRNEQVELIRQPGDYWRAKRALPASPPLVSLIIPTRNRVDLLSRCVGSILAKTTYAPFEIIVVDNASDDPATLAYLEQLRQGRSTVLRYDAPFNFSAINNFAAETARGTVLGFLNNDLEVINPEWLEELVTQALRPEIGCVGPMLYYPDDTIQHAGVVLGVGGVANHAFYHAPRTTCDYFNRAHLIQNYSAVTGACLLIRKSIFTQVGGFNAADLPVAFNDIDFCLRVRAAGYRNLWTPFAELYHHESPSRGAEDTPEKLKRFHSEVAYMREQWGPLLDRDPAYNPNLTLEQQDFSLAFPPRG